MLENSLDFSFSLCLPLSVPRCLFVSPILRARARVCVCVYDLWMDSRAYFLPLRLLHAGNDDNDIDPDNQHLVGLHSFARHDQEREELEKYSKQKRLVRR